jgi:hypothetical protein
MVNLAAKHGSHKYLLRGDFYDRDGIANFPKTEIYSPEVMPAPTLNEAARSLERLVDYCITRWSLDAPKYSAFKGLLTKPFWMR